MTTFASTSSLHEPPWHPPSDQLVWDQGLWKSWVASAISYPEDANNHCFAVEDGSYWFRHRIQSVQAIFRQFPATGTIYDIGGGNGQLALALQQDGTDTVLVEPRIGAENGLQRGVRKVIKSTLSDAKIHPRALPSVGLFDVLEHIEDDAGFLQSLRQSLAPGGRLFCTVPASQALWSRDDVMAGHFRRYNQATLTELFVRCGFEVEFCSNIFSWLPLPVWFLRTLPSQLPILRSRSADLGTKVEADHSLPVGLRSLVDRVHRWEVRRLTARRPLRFGTSVLCVAKCIEN